MSISLKRVCVKPFTEGPIDEPTVYIADPTKDSWTDRESFRPTFYVKELELLDNGWVKYTVVEADDDFFGVIPPDMVEWGDNNG